MKNKLSFGRVYSGVLYSVLAVCMVAVVGVSVYTLMYDYGSVGDISIPEVSFPSVIDNTSKPSVDRPVGSDVSGIPATEEPPLTDEAVYVNPCNGKILKNYAMTSLLYSETMQDYRTHAGIDISSALFAPVYAYTDGVIKEIKSDPFMGTTVVIEHDFALTTYYMNLGSEIPSGIEVGKKVIAGDIIGAVGSTAIVECSDEPHLHFEMRVNGTLIDPLPELLSE